MKHRKLFLFKGLSNLDGAERTVTLFPVKKYQPEKIAWYSCSKLCLLAEPRLQP